MDNPSNDQIAATVKKAVSLKAQGQYDLALTEYRRAAIMDPNLMDIQLEIGRLAREKAKVDPLFSRYSYEAFQKAAHLSLDHQQAHDEFIAASQKAGKLDVLYDQYKALLEKNPTNENLKRCVSNIRNLVMAMIPANVSAGDDSFHKKIRKVLLIAGVGAILFGVVLMFAPVILKSVKKTPISKTTAQNLFRAGLTLAVGGGLSIVSRAFVK